MTANMNALEEIKALAIETHSRQADEFARAYTVENPYADCFNYSRYRLDDLLRRFMPAPTGTMSLLDVGCGTGHHMQRYAAMGYCVAGVDGSEEMLRYAKSNNPSADVRRADVEALPFSDGVFDVVVAIEVLRYLPDLTRTVAEMRRVLKPGGICFATASPLFSLNAYPLVNRLAVALPLPSLVRLKQFFATSWGLERQFKAGGFASVDVHGVYFGPVNWVERLVPERIAPFLRRWERIDRALADRPLVREISNMFLIRAVR